ncbi:MAG: PaaI family thioesterase [Chloroflexi bacterium]|nr:PaaI family thioesterase [Chloroflexota bacterium]
MTDHEPQRVAEMLFLKNLGFQVERAAEGRCRISAPVTPQVINPYGVLHGGVTFTLADTGMGIAVATLMASDERTTTVECSIRYLLPAKSGRIVADCRVIRRSNRFAITEAQVFDEADNVLAVAGGSFYISRYKT